MTSPLRRKRQTTLLNTRVRSRSKPGPRGLRLLASNRTGQFHRLTARLGLGLLVVFTASVVASAAIAADERSTVDSAWSTADHSNGGHLRWRPFRPSQASQSAADTEM